MARRLTDRENKECTNDNCDNICPPWQMSVPAYSGDHAENEADDEHSEEPPLRSLLVFADQLEMDVGLLIPRVTRATPDVLAVEERDVSQC